MKHLTIVLLALASFVANAEQVYKWVDENDVVHFTEQPPNDRDYETVNVRSLSPAEARGSNEQQDTSSQAEDGTDSDEERLTRPGTEVTTEDPEKVAENCERARRNIEVIQSRRRVMVESDEGGQRRMTDDERMQLLEESRTYIAENCEDGD